MTKSRKSARHRRQMAAEAAVLGFKGPAMLIDPPSGGVPVNRGESIATAWRNTGDYLRRATSRFAHDHEAAE